MIFLRVIALALMAFSGGFFTLLAAVANVFAAYVVVKPALLLYKFSGWYNEFLVHVVKTRFNEDQG